MSHPSDPRVTSDLAALASESRRDLPGLEATRAWARDRAAAGSRKEITMSFLKRRPVLAVALAVLFLTVGGGAAYAVVNRVFLSIDPDQPAEDIRRDVEQQLEAAGFAGANVDVEKSPDRLKVGIWTDDPNDPELGKANLDVALRGEARGDGAHRTFAVSATCDLGEAGSKRLSSLASSEAFITLVKAKTKAGDDAALVAAIRSFLAGHGFHDVEIELTPSEVSVRIVAPPR
jgi:hypothetical protein